MDKILDELYQSDVWGSENESALNESRITHIVSVGSGFKPKFQERKYFIIEVKDAQSENLLNRISDAIQFMQEAKA